MLKKEDLYYMANLSKLDISDEECTLYQKDLDEIISFASIISDADLNDENLTLSSISDLRDDEKQTEFNKTEMLLNSLSKDGFITVPKVVE